MKTLLFKILAHAVHRTQPSDRDFTGLSVQQWQELYTLAKEQGVTAIVFERIQTLPAEARPPKMLLLQWYAHCQHIERSLAKMFRTSTEFAERLHGQDIPVVVLKGCAFGTFYPNPLHRECGDLDCFMLGRAKEGNSVAKEFGTEVEEDDYKHDHLHYKGLTIENHNFLTSFNNTRRGIRTELLLQRLIADGHTPIEGTHLLQPNRDFNAFFLLKHAQHHFLFEGIRVKHLLDWAFFLKAEGEHLREERLAEEMRNSRLLTFAQVFTQLCIEHLDMRIEAAWLRGDMESERMRELREAVLADTLGEQPSVFEKNIVKKGLRIARRFGRLWKFRLLSDEAYFTHVWNTFAFSSYLKREVKPLH